MLCQVVRCGATTDCTQNKYKYSKTSKLLLNIILYKVTQLCGPQEQRTITTMVPVRNNWVKHKTMASPPKHTHTQTHTHTYSMDPKIDQITVVSGRHHKHTNYAKYEKYELSQYKYYKDIIYSIMDHP